MTITRRPEPPVGVLWLLRQRGVPVDPVEEGEHRDETVALLANTIRAEKRLRSRRRILGAGAAVALSSAAVLAGWSWSSNALPEANLGSEVPATIAHENEDAPMARLAVSAGVVVATSDGDPRVVSSDEVVDIHEGDELRTSADGIARLMLPLEVGVELGAATKLWVELANESEQRLRLDLGRVNVVVPNPGGPRTVVVATPDSEVIVHGTRFTVDVKRTGAESRAVTSVHVQRGSVLVVHDRQQRVVRSGDRWSSEVSQVDDRAADGERAASAGPSKRRAVSARPTATDTALTEQNRLFQAALEARNAGDDEGVVRNVDALLTRYPESTLAPEARLLRVRSLRRTSSD